MTLRPGASLGAYRILGLAGTGGMGQVFKAEHTITRRIEALKLLGGDVQNSGEAVKRFLREIEVHARLTHPNIVTVYSAFEFEETLVMAMEYVEGRCLQGLLERGRIPVPAAVDYICQVLSALSYAHAQGIVHRDISPGNIIVTPGGSAKLMDFGLAKPRDDMKLTRGATAVGSLNYMSPEQVRCLPAIDGRADIYSVGAVLYHLVTGRTPFEGGSSFEVMLAHVDEPPKPASEFAPEIPPALNDAIMRALAKAASQRFQTAEDFLTVLEPIRADLCGEVNPVPRLPSVAAAHVQTTSPRFATTRSGASYVWILLALSAAVVFSVFQRDKLKFSQWGQPSTAEQVQGSLYEVDGSKPTVGQRRAVRVDPGDEASAAVKGAKRMASARPRPIITLPPSSRVVVDSFVSQPRLEPLPELNGHALASEAAPKAVEPVLEKRRNPLVRALGKLVPRRTKKDSAPQDYSRPLQKHAEARFLP